MKELSVLMVVLQQDNRTVFPMMLVRPPADAMMEAASDGQTRKNSMLMESLGKVYIIIALRPLAISKF